jgi:chaperonin GroEL
VVVLGGGGTELLNCIGVIEALELTGDERGGVMIVRRALESTLRQIADNAGQDSAVDVQNVRAAGKKNWGYNASTDTSGE